MSSPVRLPPNVLPRFYAGGRRIAALRDLDFPPEPRSPEEWLGAVSTVHGQALTGLARLPDGTLLRDRVRQAPVEYLGAAHVGRFGAEVALLVKLLDAGERLPVHFHPDGAFAGRELGSPFGKTEAWIVLEVEARASVRLGFSEPIDEGTLARWVSEQDSEAMLGALRDVPVAAGDALLVPAGTPHAIGAGVFILELQEPTDLSILLEWHGFPVAEDEAHLGLGWKRALSAVDRSAWSDDRVHAMRRTPERLLPAAADPFFRALELEPGDEAPAAFRIIVVLDGEGTLEHERGAPLAVKRGDVILVPHACGVARLEGETRAIACLPPPA